MAADDESVVWTVNQASAQTGISREVLRAALRKNELKGRFLGGSRGWITTREAVRKWAEGGTNGGKSEEAGSA